MKVRTLVVVVFLGLALPTGARANDDDPECSVATLRGSFGFTFTGTARTSAGPSPRAGIGRYVIDGQGNLEGMITSNADGIVLRRPLVGSYIVDADCTGSIAVTFTDAVGGQATFDMVIDDNGREFRTVSTPPDGAINPPTLTAVFRKQFSRR